MNVNMAHRNHNFTVCEERLFTLLYRIDKLLKCVDLARQTTHQQVDKAQHHIVSLKRQIKDEKLAQQEERLMANLDRAATRVKNLATLTHDKQQLAEIYLQSLSLMALNLLAEGGVVDQIRFLPCLEKDVEKRWRIDIPVVVWLNKSDQKKIKMSDIDHLKLTETSHTTYVLPRQGRGSDSKMAPPIEMPIYRDEVNRSGYDSGTGADAGEIMRFKTVSIVTGICVYNDTIFLVNGRLQMYSSRGDHIQDVIVGGIYHYPFDVTVMTQDDGDKLIFTSLDPRCLYYTPIQSVGDTCTLGTTHSKQINYRPYGLCVNHNNNLVVADRDNEGLHVYNSSGDEIYTIKLPSGVIPSYLASHSPGGYIITNLVINTFKQISWIYEGGTSPSYWKITRSSEQELPLQGVVGDSENRFLVADMAGGLFLLPQNKRAQGDMTFRAVFLNGIRPFSLFLDKKQGKLYVGTPHEVVVYDYYKLLGEERPVRYNMTRLGIKAT